MADTAINTHTNPIISQVKLPDGKTYDVHDQYAVHSADDLDRLGIGNVFNFAGVVDNVAALQAITGMTAGDVYLVYDTKTEYVYVIQEGVGSWHEFGGMHSHNHTATVRGTNQASAVNVTVAGKSYAANTTKLSASQAAPSLSKSTVLGDGTTVSVGGKGVGTVSTTALDVTVTPASSEFVKSVTVGEAAAAISELNTTTIKNPSVSSVSIPQYTFEDATDTKVTMGESFTIPNVTAATAKTASKATSAKALTASKVSTSNKTASKVTLGTAFSVPNVTGNSNVTASKISANTSVTASKATAATALAASKVTKSSVDATITGFSVADGVLTITNPTVTANTVTITDVSIPQYTFADVTASKVTASDVTATKTTLGTAFSIPNVTAATDVTAHAVTVTPVSIPQYTFADVATSQVTLGTAFTVPNVEETADVVASKATAGTALTASKVTTSNKTVVTGAKSTVQAVPSVTVTTGSALTGVSAALATKSTDADAVTVVTGVGTTGLTATVNPENVSAVTGVTEGAITIKSGTAGDVTVATGISASNVQLSGSGTAAAQAWQGSVTVQNWSDSNQTVTPNT